MNAARIAALVLIVAGILSLAYGGFSFTKETHEAKVGPLVLSVEDRKTVPIPAWLGFTAIAAGVLLLVVPAKK